jgi:hypothetical protein
VIGVCHDPDGDPLTVFSHLFHRPEPRPTPSERRLLTLMLLEVGDHDDSDLFWLFHWAAKPENGPSLDLVLEGLVAVDVVGQHVRLGLRSEKPGWVDEAIEEVMV